MSHWCPDPPEPGRTLDSPTPDFDEWALSPIISGDFCVPPLCFPLFESARSSSPQLDPGSPEELSALRSRLEEVRPFESLESVETSVESLRRMIDSIGDVRAAPPQVNI
jgi:hypothetical protein